MVTRDLTPDRLQEFKEFMEPIIGDEFGTHSNAVIKQLLKFNNEIHPMNRLESHICSACRTRAYNRCLAYYRSKFPDPDK